ncbi:hypothetical protein [Streptomyces sp. NPDC048002]
MSFHKIAPVKKTRKSAAPAPKKNTKKTARKQVGQATQQRRPVSRQG